MEHDINKMFSKNRLVTRLTKVKKKKQKAKNKQKKTTNKQKEIYHMCLKEVIAQLLYMMIFSIMNLKFKTQQRCHIKSKHFK